MQSKATQLIIIMCASLLFVQWSGLHYHTNTEGDAQGLHTTHVHGIGNHDHEHDHESDTDVSLFELSANWYKQIQYILILSITLILALTTVIVVWPPPFHTALYHRHSYWRPVLRGPPSLV